MPDDTEQSKSFIPKTRSLSSSSTTRRRSGGSVVVLISIGVLVMVILAAVGAFLYKQNLQSRLSDKQQEFQQAQSAFNPELIDELSQLEKRIETAQTLVNNHVALTTIFPLLESVTLPAIQFTSMKVSQGGEGGDTKGRADRAVVNLEGVGPDYATLALQASELSDNEQIENPTLSEFAANDDGNVNFSVMFSVPKSDILYKNTL